MAKQPKWNPKQTPEFMLNARIIEWLGAKSKESWSCLNDFLEPHAVQNSVYWRMLQAHRQKIEHLVQGHYAMLGSSAQHARIALLSCHSSIREKGKLEEGSPVYEWAPYCAAAVQFVGNAALEPACIEFFVDTLVQLGDPCDKLLLDLYREQKMLVL